MKFNKKTLGAALAALLALLGALSHFVDSLPDAPAPAPAVAVHGADAGAL